MRTASCCRQFAQADRVHRSARILLALLVEYPQCLAAVAKLARPAVGGGLPRPAPILLDELLDTRALHTPVDTADESGARHAAE